MTSEDAEQLVFEIVGGKRMQKDWPFDVKSGNGTRLEIKHAPAYQHGSLEIPAGDGWMRLDATAAKKSMTGLSWLEKARLFPTDFITSLIFLILGSWSTPRHTVATFSAQ